MGRFPQSGLETCKAAHGARPRRGRQESLFTQAHAGTWFRVLLVRPGIGLRGVAAPSEVLAGCGKSGLRGGFLFPVRDFLILSGFCGDFSCCWRLLWAFPRRAETPLPGTYRAGSVAASSLRMRTKL